MFNERLEIEGDMREDIRAELEAEALAREEAEIDAHYADWQARMGIEDPFAIEDVSSENMDGDHETALRDAGMGTDEDYGAFGPIGEDDWLDGSYEE